ncbi:MAG TPA: vWA domain-containing protein [Gaiellaceae bacterium]|nr:vWA domain-containing protein [Gaiellaceae bacterium]
MGTHEVRSFRAASRRTLALRVLFGGAAVLLLAAAVASARDLDPRDRGLLPTGTTGVVVLDLSLSIVDDESGIVRSTLRSLIEAGAPVGVVVFSDLPYELVPPGTPAQELRPIIRLLTPINGKVVNPWSDAFRSGTRISSALQLAQDMLVGDRVKDGSILLVSDLETSPDDVPATAKVLREIQRSGTPVRLLALGPSSDARALFGGILGPSAFTPLAKGPTRAPEPPDARRRPLPRTLLVLGLLFLTALAAHEWYGGRLALPRARARGRQV